jgi:hypothetical protein
MSLRLHLPFVYAPENHLLFKISPHHGCFSKHPYEPVFMLRHTFCCRVAGHVDDDLDVAPILMQSEIPNP